MNLNGRYAVYIFPALHGDGWYTDRLWVAKLWFWWRGCLLNNLFGLREVRLVDRRDDVTLKIK